MSKALQALMAGAAIGLLAVTDASATSLLGTETVTAVTSGFTDLKDTVLDVVETAFPYFLGIIGILAAPKVVKKMASSF